MKSLRHLNKYFLRYKGLLFWGFLFVIVSNLFAVLPARLIRHAIDLIDETSVVFRMAGVGKAKDAIAQQLATGTLVFLGIIFVVILLRGFFLFLMRQTIIIMSRHIEFDMKNEIYAHYQRLSLAFYRRNSTGDLMNRISEDVSRVRMYIGPAIMYTSNLIFMFVFIIGSMLQVNAQLTLFVLLPLPILSASIYIVSDRMNKRSEAVQEQQSRLSTFVQETFSGVRVLKSFVKEDPFAREFARESNVYQQKSLRLVKVNAFFFPLMLLLIGLSTILTVYIGGLEVLRGRITLGNIAEFVIYVNMLTWPVASLGWVTSIIQRAAASQQRLNEFLHLEPEITSPGGAPLHLQGSLEFDNVGLVYPDSGIRALRGVSFKVHPGKTLALLGTTGSGKSTVAALLLRLYDATEGTVRVDGRPIQSVPLEDLRNSIGYVPQDVFLFSDTIAGNIAFGLKEAVPPAVLGERVEEAARQAGVFRDIVSFPQGFETRVGERGITLSGGQKQRVSIARALIRQPAVLLLDDCLSAVDTETEERILENLRREGNRTTLIISHRVSSVKHADEIILLDDGVIVEQGSHLSLLRKKGAYYRLYERQLLEKAAEQQGR